jgi:hypothetical protein
MRPRTLTLIVGISLAVRITAYLWESFHPVPFNSLLENFMDFHAYYVSQLSFLHEGYLPYRDFPYAYPPLFLYSLYPFYLLGTNAAAIPIVVGDALTAPVLYLIVRKVGSERSAIGIAIAYALSPFFLTYEGISWLSEQPMLFFLLLSVLMLQKEKPKSSSILFAVAILFKQDALFILPAYIYWFYRICGVKSTLRNLGLSFAVLAAGSLPFLLLSPLSYLSSVSLGKFYSAITYLVRISVSSSRTLSVAGGFSTTSLNVTLPNLTCSTFYNNIFGASQVCVGVGQNGQAITNYVLYPEAPGVQNIFLIVTLALILGGVLCTWVVPRRSRFAYSFALSVACIVIPMMLFDQLSPYKYYLVPLFALLIACCDDLPSAVIVSVFPILALLSQYSSITLLIPLFEMQTLAAKWYLKKRWFQQLGATPVGTPPRGV